MRKKIYLLAAPLLLAGGVNAATLATWTNSDTGNQVLEGTDVSGNVTTSNSTFGAGLAFVSNSTEIPNGDVLYKLDVNETQTGQTIAQAAAENQYIEFSFTVSGLAFGTALQIDGVSYGMRRNANTGQVHGADFSQVDVDGSLIGSLNTHADSTLRQIENATAVTYGNGDTFTGRLYLADFDNQGSNSTNGNRSSRVGNIIVTGDIVAVPEPSASILLGLGGLALILRRRK